MFAFVASVKELAKARRKQQPANPNQLSMFAPSVGSKLHSAMQAAGVSHVEAVQVKPHTRQTEHGPVTVAPHVRMVAKVDPLADAQRKGGKGITLDQHLQPPPGKGAGLQPTPLPPGAKDPAPPPPPPPAPTDEHIANARLAYETMQPLEDEMAAAKEATGRGLRGDRSKAYMRAKREWMSHPKEVRDAVQAQISRELAAADEAAAAARAAAEPSEDERAAAWQAQVKREREERMARRQAAEAQPETPQKAAARAQAEERNENQTMIPTAPPPTPRIDATTNEHIKHHNDSADFHDRHMASLALQGDHNSQKYNEHRMAFDAHKKAADAHHIDRMAIEAGKPIKMEIDPEKSATQLGHAARWRTAIATRADGQPEPKPPQLPRHMQEWVSAQRHVSPIGQKTSFSERFEAEFGRLRGDREANLIPLAHLRAAFPEMSREQFDAALFDLRKTGRFFLEEAEGRHGKPPPEQIEAAIKENGRRFVYASRRDTEEESEAEDKKRQARIAARAQTPSSTPAQATGAPAQPSDTSDGLNVAKWHLAMSDHHNAVAHDLSVRGKGASIAHEEHTASSTAHRAAADAIRDFWGSSEAGRLSPADRAHRVTQIGLNARAASTTAAAAPERTATPIERSRRAARSNTIEAHRDAAYWLTDAAAAHRAQERVSNDPKHKNAREAAENLALTHQAHIENLHKLSLPTRSKKTRRERETAADGTRDALRTAQEHYERMSKA